MRFGLLISALFASAAIAAPTATEKSLGRRFDSLDDQQQGSASSSYGGGSESVPSGVAALTSSVDVIAANIKNANDTLNAFEPGLSGIGELLKIQSATTQLGDSIKNTTAIAKATGNLSLADSATFGTKFLSLEPQIFSLLDNLKSRRPDFDKAGFGLIDVVSLLRQNIQEQKELAADLGDAIIAILDPSLKSTAEPVNNDIQARFDSTIAAFQGKGGLIQIPPGLIGLLSGGGGASE